MKDIIDFAECAKPLHISVKKVLDFRSFQSNDVTWLEVSRLNNHRIYINKKRFETLSKKEYKEVAV